MQERLRTLPSVDELVREAGAHFPLPHAVLVREARLALAEARQHLKSGRETDCQQLFSARLADLLNPSLRPVINATGVVLHTNLGRAPLGSVTPLPGYSNLEYDLGTGRRGKRDVHVSRLLERLLNHPGLVVNNNAAAVFLALHELAGGGEVLISRGELIEIGDGFRIPDIMARSGAILREVGTTNRTRLEDYRSALNERTRLIMRVHPSNFRITGFTARPSLPELARLAAEAGLPLYEDLGSGCLVDLRPAGVDEPLPQASLAAGASLVSFSGDKLLGGPQAGILAGRADLVERIRRNPLFRALRVDKLTCQLLEHTLRLIACGREREIPALRMIFASADEIRSRALRLAPQINAQVVPGRSMIGGGSTPEQSLPTWLLRLPDKTPVMECRLRTATTPVIARIEDDHVVLDLRTVFPEEEDELAQAVLQARSR